MGKTIRYFVDSYVQTEVGEPFRLLPFGKLYRGEHVIDFTPEMAERVRLPHYKPPIKLGGHADDLPAGGHIVGLEVRDDGLYGVPEWTEKGQQRMAEGDYRYQSPEILWDGWIEDATTGNRTEGPAITGMALLHNPALGEAAAFYSANSDEHEEAHMSDTVQVPASIWERALDALTGGGQETQPEPNGQPPQPQRGESDQLAALKEKAGQVDELTAKVEQYESRIAEMEAQERRAERVAHFAAEFEDTAAADDKELHEALADLDDEQADKIVQKFKALAAQVDDSLEEDVGASGDGQGADSPQAKVDAAVKAKMTETGTGYVEAFEAVRREQPDLFQGLGR